MKILFLLIPLSILLLGIAIWAFFWAVRSGQFDDLDSPAYRILLDDDDPQPREHSSDHESNHDGPDRDPR